MEVQDMLSRTDQRYQSIIDRVELIARQQAGEQLHIGFLCRSCGVTERTLRNAFRSIRDATPYRYLRERRLAQAREALLRADAGETVTSIATQFGFMELGRFSVEYRSTFGERPSETLRRSQRSGYSECGVPLRSDPVLRWRSRHDGEPAKIA
jgi:transcriptional regulator GlxA family with amidase domain